MRPELTYDGHGINGPDEYRTRLATFNDKELGAKYGPLFAAAPELLDFAKEMESYLELKLDGWRRVDGLPENHAIVATAVRFLSQCRAAIAKATGALGTVEIDGKDYVSA